MVENKEKRNVKVGMHTVCYANYSRDFNTRERLKGLWANDGLIVIGNFPFS
jgi:hypothetical protein